MNKNIVLTIIIVLATALAPLSFSQSTLQADRLVGAWQAPLVISRNEVSITLTFSIDDGELQARLTSDGLGVYGLPADSVSVDGLHITTVFSRLDAEISGWLRLTDAQDGIIRIDGDWFQDAEMVPVVLRPEEH